VKRHLIRMFHSGLKLSVFPQLGRLNTLFLAISTSVSQFQTARKQKTRPTRSCLRHNGEGEEKYI